MIPAGCAAHSAAARAVARLAALSDGRSSSACRSCSCSLHSGTVWHKRGGFWLNRLDRGSKRYTTESKKAKLTVHAVRSHRLRDPQNGCLGLCVPQALPTRRGSVGPSSWRPPPFLSHQIAKTQRRGAPIVHASAPGRPSTNINHAQLPLPLQRGVVHRASGQGVWRRRQDFCTAGCHGRRVDDGQERAR